MHLTYNHLGELVLTIKREFPSVEKEISGYITTKGDYKIFFGTKTSAPFFDKEISFHTHPMQENFASVQDVKSLFSSEHLKFHVLLAPKKIFVFRRMKRGSVQSKIANVELRLFDGTLFDKFNRTVATWKRQWKTWIRMFGFEVYEYSYKEFTE